jgi:hypothetical protein
MSSYILNCWGVNCAYCVTYYDTHEKYKSFTSEELIRELHGASTNAAITECQRCVKEFYENIAADRVPEGAVAKFNIRYIAGCYMKRYINQLLLTYADKNDFDVNVLVRERSKATNMYYYNVVGMTDGWHLSLFFASRFDVLDELHELGHDVTSNCSILNYFSARSIPVSDEMLEHLALYTSVDKVVTSSLPICTRKFVATLAKQKPTTTWDITRIIEGDSFELFLRVLKLLVPDTESRKTMILKNLENLKDLYDLDSLYQHLITEVLRLSA